MLTQSKIKSHPGICCTLHIQAVLNHIMNAASLVFKMKTLVYCMRTSVASKLNCRLCSVVSQVVHTLNIYNYSCRTTTKFSFGLVVVGEQTSYVENRCLISWREHHVCIMPTCPHQHLLYQQLTWV